MSTFTTMTTVPSFLIGLTHPFLPHLNLFFINLFFRSSCKNTNWTMSPNCLIPFKGFTLFMGVEKQCPPHGLGSVPALGIAFPQPHSCHTKATRLFFSFFDPLIPTGSALHTVLFPLPVYYSPRLTFDLVTSFLSSISQLACRLLKDIVLEIPRLDRVSSLSTLMEP